MLNIPDDKYILELDNINKYSMSITSLYESLSNNTQVKKDHERIRVLLAYYFSLPPEEVSFSKFKKILDSTKLPRIIQNLGNEKSFTHARDKYLPVCHLILADAACDLKNSFIKYVTDNLTVASYFRKKLLAMSSKHATPKHLFLPEGFISIPKEFDLYVSEISEDLKKHWDMCGKKLFNPL
ncbi:hypothetical protein Megvenef_01455 [Candidatus Megaera venefica]|uniref:Uncharacterized protein n=2 Tax=Candidatus Megaera venefica TaxID=2055910 RepID=A0ABU5NE70_9RICK|nr:hypothetical protein [Candidatus Megaera venefica]